MAVRRRRRVARRIIPAFRPSNRTDGKKPSTGDRFQAIAPAPSRRFPENLKPDPSDACTENVVASHCDRSYPRRSTFTKPVPFKSPIGDDERQSYCLWQKWETLITEICLKDDHAIADLLSTLSLQYRKQIADPTLPKNKTRLEMIRKIDKIELICQSIKGLMKHEQEGIGCGSDH